MENTNEQFLQGKNSWQDRQLAATRSMAKEGCNGDITHLATIFTRIILMNQLTLEGCGFLTYFGLHLTAQSSVSNAPL